MPGISGPIVDIVKKFDRAVDVWSPATPIGLCLRDRRAAGHEAATSWHAGHRDRSQARSRDGDSSAPRPTTPSWASAPSPRTPSRARAARAMTGRSAIASAAPLGHRDGCRGRPNMNDRRKRARRPSWPMRSSRHPRARQWRRADGLHQSRRHPHRHRQKRRTAR